MIKIVVSFTNAAFTFGQSAKEIVTAPSDFAITWGAAWANMRLVGCSIHAQITVAATPVPLELMSCHLAGTTQTGAVPAPVPASLGGEFAQVPVERKIFTKGFNNPSKPMLCVAGVNFQSIYMYPLRTSTGNLVGDIGGFIELDFLPPETFNSATIQPPIELKAGQSFQLVQVPT
jgi:hypothetical protein